MYCIVALVASLFATQAYASTISSRTLATLQARQIPSIDPSTVCSSECQPFVDQTNSCVAKPTSQQVGCICSDTYFQTLGSCANCAVKDDASKRSDLQKAMDNVVSECSKDGFSVKEPVLDGGSSNGASLATGISGLTVAVAAVGIVVFV